MEIDSAFEEFFLKSHEQKEKPAADGKEPPKKKEKVFDKNHHAFGTDEYENEMKSHPLSAFKQAP